MIDQKTAPFAALALLAFLSRSACPVGWQFGNKGGGREYSAFRAVALLVHFLLGDGAFAIKHRRHR
jgi:hypothetical protein